MKKENLFIIGAIIVVLGIGTVIGLEQIKNAKTTIPEESNKANETTQTPEQVLAGYNQTRTAEQREAVMEKIKAIFGEDLQITFKEAKTRYYSYGIPDPATITDFAQLKVIETYEDNKGFKTEVDAEANEILNRAKDCTAGTKWITADQAKETAQNLLAKLVPDPESYKLTQENALARTYYTNWKKIYKGDFYNLIPSAKGQEIAKSEWRTIVICDLSGELFSYEYKPALTEEEIIKMADQLAETKKRDIEAIREFLGDPNAELTFVNWLTITAENKTYKVYKDEKGHRYDVDENRNVLPDTETLK